MPTQPDPLAQLMAGGQSYQPGDFQRSGPQMQPTGVLESLMGAFSPKPWGVADTFNAVMSALPGARPGVRAYHSSPKQFDKFELRPSSKNEQAVFFSSDPEKMFGEHGYEVQLNPRNQQNYRWSEFSSDPIYDPDIMKTILNEAKTQGADLAKISGVQNFEHGPKSTTYAVSDPSIIDILRRYGLAGVAPPAAAALVSGNGSSRE